MRANRPAAVETASKDSRQASTFPRGKCEIQSKVETQRAKTSHNSLARTAQVHNRIESQHSNGHRQLQLQATTETMHLDSMNGPMKLYRGCTGRRDTRHRPRLGARVFDRPLYIEAPSTRSTDESTPIETYPDSTLPINHPPIAARSKRIRIQHLHHSS